jgi:hypothetical protein
MKYKSLIIPILCLLLSACETMPPMQPRKTQAMYEYESAMARGKITGENLRICADETKTTSFYKRTADEILFLKKDSENKYSLMLKKERLTEEQVEFFKSAIPTLTKCRQIVIDGLAGTPYHILQLQYNNSMDTIYIKLLKREIAIGEANEEKARIFTKYEVEWSSAHAEMVSKWQSMDRAEMEGRRQSAAAMLPYMLQQQQSQQNLAMQQQLLNQQQMQNIIKAPPILRSPTTTNCTTYGNQLNCTTQ